MKKPGFFIPIACLTLCLSVLACSTLSNLPSSETGTPSALPPTATHTVTPTATPTFTPPATYTPVYSPTPETLTSDFIELCEKAFNKNISSGSVQLPILPLVNVTYQKGGWVRGSLASHIEAGSMGEAKTIMCLKENRQKAFGYSDGSSAYRRIREVRLIEVATGNVFASGSYAGDEPPPVKFQSGDTYGSVPTNRIFEELGLEFEDTTTIDLDTPNGVLALSLDGRYLAHCALRDLIRIRDLTTGETTREWVSLQDPIDHLEFSPDGKILLSSSSFMNPSTVLWDVQSGKLLHSFYGGKGMFSPDGSWVLTSAADPVTMFDGVKIWDTSNGNELQSINDSFAFPAISEITISPSGETLALYGLNPVSFWDIQTRQVINTISVEQGFVEQFDYSPDGSLFAMAIHHDTTRIEIWNIATGEMVHRIDPIGNPNAAPLVHSFSFSPDGRFLAAGLGDGTVRVWETTTWLEIHTFFDDLGNIDAVVFSPDGRTLYVGATSKIKLFDLSVK